MSEMTQAPAARAIGAVTQKQIPGLVSASLTRVRVELVAFFRDWQSMLFNMALPVMMMLVFGAVFNQKVPGTDVDYRLLFISGMIAVGVMSTTFQEGLIRRLAASPMPRGAYFIGITVKALVTTILEVIILMVLGMVLYHLPMPSDATRWFTLVWVVLLGVSSCSLAGLAYTALIPNARAAAGAATPPFLILQIISGVFFPLSMIPAALAYIGYAFPLLWMAKGLRFVFLPESLASAEPGGTWDLGTVAIVLGVWTVVGGVLAALTFKWRGQRVK